MTDKLITHEEAREINRIGKRTFISALDMINCDDVEVKQDNKNYVFPKDLDKIDDYIAQQEQFAKDVARFIELAYKEDKDHADLAEYYTLEEKLTKGVAK